MQELVAALRSSQRCVAFSGAGVSTLSGLRDFRGKSGIYKDMDAERIFDINQFRVDPSLFYRQGKDLVYNLGEIEPSIVHRQLARMEQMGIITAVITQNIDMLHQKAGSRRVIEIHGSPRRHHCLSCHREYSYEWVCRRLQEEDVPYCECGGAIKPDITFYGESLDRRALNQAIHEAEQADLMLILGTSLLVQPAASLPCYTLRNGHPIIIVNDMPTPLDDYASLRYSDLGEVFSYLSEHL